MAFNQPIEADRPDNLDLLTTFSRAPILGTLMWLLGGDMALKLDEEERKESNIIQINDMDKVKEMGNKVVPSNTTGSTPQYENNNHVPDRILSDISECSAVEGEATARLSKSFDEFTIQDRSESNRSLNTNQPGVMKKMSWSDESGQSLVEYSNESSSHEPRSAAIPMKSAMKRSNSIYSNPLHRTNSNESSSEPSHQALSSDGNESSISMQRYIPSLGGKMPPRAAKPMPNGYISPQWGWYINTTPPPHEMYSSKKPDIDKKEENVNPNSDNTFPRKEKYKPPSMAGPLPMFKHSIATPSHGWPNVPL